MEVGLMRHEVHKGPRPRLDAKSIPESVRAATYQRRIDGLKVALAAAAGKDHQVAVERIFRTIAALSECIASGAPYYNDHRRRLI
jgi:hypothetical protein